MTKKELTKCSNEDLIVDYVKTYSSYCVNLNLQRGIERLFNHQKDLEKEMLKRNILSQHAIDYLNW